MLFSRSPMSMRRLKGLTGSASVGRRLAGGYAQLGYDLLNRSATSRQLIPFFRCETLDAQAAVPRGFDSNPANDTTILTHGLSGKLCPQIVAKTDCQIREDGASAGGEARAIPGVVPYYVGRRDGTPLGVAYFDAHRIRTMQEVVMVVVSPAGTVERVDVLRFLEPPEYMAPGPWIDQLTGAPLSDDLAVNRGVVNLTGATLTAQAITRAVRRVLALNEVIRPLAAPVGGGRS